MSAAEIRLRMAESKIDIADAANGVTVTAPESIEVAKADAENPVMFDLSDIVVKTGDTTLRYGVDYVISYENNTDFGTAKLVIKGIDGYTGILEHTFAITQKAKVMTGITWVSKESVFSDLNNLKVITITSEEYADCFGFTEEEVFAALEQTGLEDKKTDVKEWYDGFIFGSLHDIYNPWSITNYLDTRKLQPFWASTSSNSLVSRGRTFARTTDRGHI